MREKLKKIKLLLIDVDGVLTDGRIIYDNKGRQIKMFDVQDGFGLVLFQKLGYKTAILTARGSNVVNIRAKDLLVNKIYLNAYPKINLLGKISKDFRIKPFEMCYIGDDLPDCQVMKAVGFSVAVKNAAPEVKKIADYITKKQGGRGAVREVVEMILKANNKWNTALKRFL